MSNKWFFPVLLAVFLSATMLAAGCGIDAARQAGERAAGQGESPEEVEPENANSSDTDTQDEPAAEESPEPGAEVEPAGETSPEPATEEPAESPEMTTEETSGMELTQATGESELENVMLTGGDAGSGEAGSGEAQPVTEFRMRMDEISVVGSVSGVPAGTEVGVFWIARDVPESDYVNGALSDEELYEDSVEVEGDRPFELEYGWEEDPLAFSYQIGNDLPPGEYAAEVTLNGGVVETLDFTVYKPSLPVVAYPGRELPGSPAAAPSEVPATRLQFVLDASASMNDVVGGVPKIEAARGAMQSLVTALPDNAEGLDVGLRAYSHREATEDDVGCEDTELLTPMDGVNKETMRGQIDSLQAVGGRTPMAGSIEAAVEDFSGGDQNNALVLVSDGQENCNEDPVGAIEAAAGGADLTVHVVGFDITEQGARDQLQQIAESTGGIYVDAPNPEALSEALYEIAQEQIEVVTVQSGAGEVLVDPPRGTELDDLTIYNEAGDAVVEEYGPAEDVRGAYQLPAGTYTGVIEPSGISEEAGFRFEVGAGRETKLGLGGLRINTRQVPDEIALLDQESALIGWEAYTSGDGEDSFLDQPMTVPPGTYTVLFQSSGIADFTPVAQDVEIQANQVVTLEP